MRFVSPTDGPMTLTEVVTMIAQSIVELPDDSYRLIIGSDSQTKHVTLFVTAIILHRVGKGARYFYRKTYTKPINSLRQRIYYETTLSLEIAEMICTPLLKTVGDHELNIEIHVDIGSSGATRTFIKEIMGMVLANGYQAFIKPEAYGAAKVADRHSKKFPLHRSNRPPFRKGN